MLTLLMLPVSNLGQAPTVTVLAKTTLPYFTTSNGLETYKRNLVAIGNNASVMLIMDTLLQVKDTLKIISNETAPDLIARKRLADMNTTAIVQFEGQDVLTIMNTTFSSQHNSLIYLLPLNTRGRKEIILQSFTINDFFRQLRKKGLKQININGSSGFGNRMILANSSSKGRKRNHLIVCDVDFWQKGINTNFNIVPIQFAEKSINLTGLTYVASADMILFTASSKTNGGANYAGSIRHASTRMAGGATVTPDFMLSAENLDSKAFRGSLESLSVDVADEQGAVLYLLENELDKSSTIYRVRVQFAVSGK